MVDAVTLFGVMIAIATVRFGFSWPTYPVSHYLIGFGVATAIHIGAYYFGGLYEYEQRLGRPPWLPRATLMTLLAVGAVATVTLLTGRYLMPRGNLAALAITASLIVSFNRWLARRVRSRRFGRPQVLLAGTDRDIASATEHLGESEPELDIVGSVSDVSDVLVAVASSGATDVLLLSSQPLEDAYPEPVGELQERNIGVYRRIAAADTLLGLQRTRQIGGMPFVVLRAHTLPACRLRFKRLLDLVHLLVLAPVILPLCGLVATYVRLRAGQGVLFRQCRVGRRGREFVMVKFRTMRIDAESKGPQLATANDPRVVAGMAWLRRSRLDELPQLWNVVRGSMSIVGPRPNAPNVFVSLNARSPGYGRRHDIYPGITGLAQIQGHYQTDPAYKLGHDLQYVVNWSPVLDWEIMAKSLLVMARRSAR